MENKLIVGLIKGRHEMPVTDYIFEEVENVLDFPKMEKHITNWLIQHVGLIRAYDIALNEDDYTEVLCWKGHKDLVVYVTGLTAVTAELIKVCAINGVCLTLMHFDRESGEYVPQKIFR